MQKTNLQRIWGRLARIAGSSDLWDLESKKDKALWQERVPQPHMIIREVKEGCKYRILEVVNRKKKCKEKKWIEQIHKKSSTGFDLESMSVTSVTLMAWLLGKVTW